VSSSATGELEHHMPALRHTLIMLLSAQSPEALAEPAGREPLRKAALEAVRKVVADAGVAGTAEEPAVQDLLFTSFLVQR
jgi:flagellar FliL protein